MATRRSGMLEALDYYWNRYWSSDNKITLIVCGSSASWLIKKILYNKGGLHNRCTQEIKLEPFSLTETFSYFKSRNIKLTKKHILHLYMALGGIPYYLRYVKPGKTAIENIQDIIFEEGAPLREEYYKLFHSLFSDASSYMELVELIAKNKKGISRSELEAKSKTSKSGGRFSERLTNLCQTSFVTTYIPWGKQTGEYYKVIDEFCLFYIHWVKTAKTRVFPKYYWQQKIMKPTYHVWSGYAFEALCSKHINKIISAFNLPTIETISSWRFVSKDQTKQGAQIDLLIERNDDAIMLCEIKFTDQIFTIDKAYAKAIERKIQVFTEQTGTQKQILFCLISANGVKKNQYSKSLVSKVITLNDLF